MTLATCRQVEKIISPVNDWWRLKTLAVAGQMLFARVPFEAVTPHVAAAGRTQ